MKKIRFDETAKIRLIRPLFNFKHILWWNDFDYIMFKTSASTEIMLAMDEYHCYTSREAMRFLYQPGYNNKCIMV